MGTTLAAILFYALLLTNITPEMVECSYESTPDSETEVIGRCPVPEPKWITVDLTGIAEPPKNQRVRPMAGLRIKMGDESVELTVEDMEAALKVLMDANNTAYMSVAP